MGSITEMHVGIAIVTMVTLNVDGETNIPVTLMHGRRKAKLFWPFGVNGTQVKED